MSREKLPLRLNAAPFLSRHLQTRCTPQRRGLWLPSKRRLKRLMTAEPAIPSPSINASMRQYFDVLMARDTLTKQPMGWNDVQNLLKLCYGSRGQKGCFSVNSMREFSDLPPKARQIMLRT